MLGDEIGGGAGIKRTKNHIEHIDETKNHNNNHLQLQFVKCHKVTKNCCQMNQ